MIRSWRDRQARRFFETGRLTSGVAWAGAASIAARKLDMLDAASALTDLKMPPGNRLEALKGDRKGQYSIRINRQFRICFEWNEGAEHVEITDYH